MKKFVIERRLPGGLSPEELQTISQTSGEVVNQLGKPYLWIQSFVTEDKIYCIYIAESEEMIRKHTRLDKFPINTVAEIRAVIDTTTGNHFK